MARKATPLSDTQVKQAKPRDKDYELSDGEGLTLRIRSSGTKVWLFKYHKPFSKKRSNFALGNYPELSLANARKKKQHAKDLLLNDIDPKDHKNEKHQKEELAHSNTLENVAKQYHEVKKTTISKDHAKDIWRSLEIHLFPSLGSIPIHKLNAPTTLQTLKPISAKSAETAKRLSQRLNEIMTYAVNTGLIHHNPLAGINSALRKPIKKNMPTIKPSELPDLMRALSTASIKLVTRYLIEWQLHTMVRPSEAAGARWDEINKEKEQWIIPAERMKKKKQHIVPLTSQTLLLLENIRHISGKSEFIFPGDRNPRKPSNSATANVALKRMGYHGKLVSHGLRALASTTLNEEGFDHDVIEACLAHVDKNEVRAAYNRAEYLERRKKVLGWWSQHIENASAGNISLATYANRPIVREH